MTNQFDEYLDKNLDNMIEKLSDLISFNSVSNEESTDPTHPFGEECTKALKYTLSLANSLGFRTKNIENKCGYIEFGEGEELVGIIGHLDVVPADISDGWTQDPFTATITDGKLFGRGSIDDKGPMIAALYAMKAILDSNVNLNKRVRLILGLNEEKSWKCINRYKETEEFPTIGFSPDANFPAIYAEKGIISISLKHKFNIKGFDIIDIDCGNNAINVVPKYAAITLKYSSKLFRPVEFESYQNPLFNMDIEVQNVSKDEIKIISYGKAAHAAHPELGINAITNLVKYLCDRISISDEPNIKLLEKLLHLGFFDFESPEFLSRKEIAYPTEFEDDSVIQDESGILTSNVANLIYDKESEILEIKLNLRVPVTYSLDSIFLKYRKLVEFFEDIEVTSLNRQEPLYVKQDSYLVKTLVNIFNNKANMDAKPIAIGGGTYARAFENFISYGVTMPGEKDMCHQVDEFIKIDDLLLASKIYAEAIYELAK